SSAGRAAPSLHLGWLLPDVEPRPFGSDPSQGRSFGDGVETGARTVCRLLERDARFQRACLARTVLFLSVGFGALVGGVALRRTQSGAGRTRSQGSGVEMVERGGALRGGRAGCLSGHGDLAEILVL